MKLKITSLSGLDDPVSERIRLVEYLNSSERVSFAVPSVEESGLWTARHFRTDCGANQRWRGYVPRFL